MARKGVGSKAQGVEPVHATLPGGKEYFITAGNVETAIEGFTGDAVTGVPQFFQTYGLHKDVGSESLPMINGPKGAGSTPVPTKFFGKTKKTP